MALIQGMENASKTIVRFRAYLNGGYNESDILLQNPGTFLVAGHHHAFSVLEAQVLFRPQNAYIFQTNRRGLRCYRLKS
jgi:hypothetical protein